MLMFACMNIACLNTCMNRSRLAVVLGGQKSLKNGKTRDRRLRLKPALIQDADYMVEKTYHIAPAYLGIFNASVTHIWLKIRGQVGHHVTQWGFDPAGSG